MTTAFCGGPVFIGDGRISDKATVIVEGERIARVASGDAPLPRGARRVDLAGGMLLPGLIDCHVHFCLDGGPDPVGSAQRAGLPLMTLKAAQFARQTLLAGVTAVRDMGGSQYVDLAIRDAVRDGLIPGPRILASGRLVCMTGGTGWTFGGREADGPEEVRKAVREQIKAGADLVKIMATGGVITPGVEPGSPQYTEAELRAGVEEAHKAGRRVASHAQGTQGVLNALRAGVDSIEHGIFLDDETIALMAERGVALVPTLAPVHNIERQGLEAGLPEWMVAKTHRVKGPHLDSLRRARQAGLKIALGTDAGCPFNRHGANLTELRLLVESGFSPAEALRAATLTAAETLGRQGELGSVEAGKLADLVVVEGDPLADVCLLEQPERLRLIMQGGRIIDRD